MDDVNQLFSRLEGEEWPPVAARGADLRRSSDVRRRRRTTLAVGATTAAVVAVLVGTQLPHHDASVGVVPGGSPVPRATAYAPATPTASAPVPLQRCTVASLTVRIHAGDAGAGQRFAEIWVTNSSSRPCTITGFGGGALVSPVAVFTTTFVRSAAKPRRVLLRPGDIASSLLHWTPMEARGTCDVSPSAVRITPPDERSSISARWPAGEVCTKGHINQEPYVAGRGR